MNKALDPSAALAASLTRAGSRHTYLTICWLVDRDLVSDAFRAYAYFRWLDDVIDVMPLSRDQRLAFFREQKSLMTRLHAGDRPQDLAPEEATLACLIEHDRRSHGGLDSYLRNMMAVMEFDARRRGRLISQDELDGYTRNLSTAVMDGLSYFIGHHYGYPETEERYHAVAAAHISHMLRDAVADAEAGYYNIPREVLEAGRIAPSDFHAPAYQDWVRSRVALAQDLFRQGKRYIRRLDHLRARLAGLAYCARFESVLDTIERADYVLQLEDKRARRPALQPALSRSSASEVPGAHSTSRASSEG